MYRYKISAFILMDVAACLLTYGLAYIYAPKYAILAAIYMIFVFIFSSGAYRKKSVELGESSVLFNSFRLYDVNEPTSFSVEYKDISAVYVKKLPIMGIRAIVICPENLNQQITVSVCYKNYREMYGELVKNVLRANPEANIASELKRYISEKGDFVCEEADGFTSKEIKALHPKSDKEKRADKKQILFCSLAVLYLITLIVDRVFSVGFFIYFLIIGLIAVIIFCCFDKSLDRDSKKYIIIILSILLALVLIAVAVIKFDMHFSFTSTTTTRSRETTSEKLVCYEVGDMLNMQM